LSFATYRISLFNAFLGARRLAVLVLGEKFQIMLAQQIKGQSTQQLWAHMRQYSTHAFACLEAIESIPFVSRCRFPEKVCRLVTLAWIIFKREKRKKWLILMLCIHIYGSYSELLAPSATLNKQGDRNSFAQNPSANF
jgi:hypothetical protein